MKLFYVHIVLVLCICNAQKFVQAEAKPISDQLACDCSRFESQIETLKTGNDLLNLRMVVIQNELNKQKEIFGDLERKIYDFPRHIEALQEILLQDIKYKFIDLKDFLTQKIQVPVASPTDDKIFVMVDIKKILKDQDNILDNILDNVVSDPNSTPAAITELPKDNATTTQTPKKLGPEKIAALQKINEKLNKIANNSTPKTQQIKLPPDVQQRQNSIKTCGKGDTRKQGLIKQAYPTNCANFDAAYCADKKCCIRNRIYGAEPFLVSCNDHIKGGGWTVIQRRINGSVDFYRNWSEYKAGFGNIDGEFFIGLDKLHALTSTLKPVELLIQLGDFYDNIRYAKYDDFQVGNEKQLYKLIKVGSYNGDAGDSFSYNEGFSFTTKDRDNDRTADANCAVYKTGAWWYGACSKSNLNGKYYHDPNELLDAPVDKRGINWYTFHGYEYSLKLVQMMIRPQRK